MLLLLLVLLQLLRLVDELLLLVVVSKLLLLLGVEHGLRLLVLVLSRRSGGGSDGVVRRGRCALLKSFLSIGSRVVGASVEDGEGRDVDLHFEERRSRLVAAQNTEHLASCFVWNLLCIARGRAVDIESSVRVMGRERSRRTQVCSPECSCRRWISDEEGGEREATYDSLMWRRLARGTSLM